MKVEIRANGRLEFRLYDPVGPVQEAALKALREAIAKQQNIKPEIDGDVVVLAVLP